jgi:predicted nucleic acid-binding protein
MKSSTASEALFLDTWGWLVLANDRDPSFSAVTGLRRDCAENGRLWVTTDYVLDETITRLFAGTSFAKAQQFCDAIFESAKLELLAVEPITQERFQRAYKMRLRYRDKPRVSFTDLTSFTVMRELGIRHVLTADAHFQQAGLGFHRLP